MNQQDNLPPMGQTVKIKVKEMPFMMFEWHPGIQKVYVMRIDDLTAKSTKADIIAEHVVNQAQAYGFVQTYLRGYRRAQTWPKPPDEGVPGSG